MRTIEIELNRKRYILYRLMKQQDKRKDLSYKTDKELELLKEIKKLERRIKNEKEICIKKLG